MKFIIILLSLALLISGVGAVKLDASTQIDWSEFAGGPINITYNWTDHVYTQIHDVVNGTAKQDAVTYSQLLQPGGNVSYSGYVQSGQLAPQTSSRVFLFTVPWLGLQRAVALRADGWPLSISSSNSTAIQAALNLGGKVELCNMFDISTSLQLNHTVVLAGNGPTTGVRGSVNPLINISEIPSVRWHITEMGINVTGTNTGVEVWTNSSKAAHAPNMLYWQIDHNVLTSEAGTGTLIHLSALEGIDISHNMLMGPNDARNNPSNTAVGIRAELLNAFSYYGNCGWANNYFVSLHHGIYATGRTDRSVYAYGIRIVDSTFISCYYGILLQYIDTPTIIGCMIDNDELPVKLHGCNSPSIIGSYIATQGQFMGVALWVRGEGLPLTGGRISNCDIRNLNATAPNYAMLFQSVGSTDYERINRWDINHNMIDNGEVGILVLATTPTGFSENAIDFNTFRSSSDSNIYLTAGLNNSVRYNRMFNTTVGLRDLATGTISTGNYHNGVPE
jgi:hypothetical protein